MKVIRLECMKRGAVSLLLGVVTAVAVTGISMGQSFEKPAKTFITTNLGVS